MAFRNLLILLLKRFSKYSIVFNSKLFFISAANFFKYGDFRFPQAVWIEVLTQCNRACYYCPNSVKPITDQFIDREVFSKILNRLKEINWTGPVGYHYLSEPLLHPDICYFINETKRVLPRSLPIIFTNGDFLDMEMAGNLVLSGVERVAITRHPPIKKGWDERINNIKEKYPDIFVSDSIDKKQLMNIAGVVAVNNPKLGYCNSPKRVIPIRINGDISICCCDYEQKFIEGNVLEKPILELWKNKKWSRVRKELRKGKTPYKICENCTGAR